MIYKMNGYRNSIPMYQFPIKLDLGAGQYPKEGFVRMDFDPNNVDICWDITNGIPLPNDSVSELFTSHFLEHLIPTDLHYVLMEMLRVCQNGARVEIIVPYGETEQGHLPCHYSRITESTMKAWANWRQETDQSRYELQEIKRDGYHLIGIFKIVKNN
jgi:predicted SAM-dependent methyltransferase